jgi:hypothetical protein
MDSQLVRTFLAEAIEICKIITQNSHLVLKYSMVGFTFIFRDFKVKILLRLPNRLGAFLTWNDTLKCHSECSEAK